VSGRRGGEEEGGRRKEEGGMRKEERGRKEEGGRRKEEEGEEEGGWRRWRRENIQLPLLWIGFKLCLLPQSESPIIVSPIIIWLDSQTLLEFFVGVGEEVVGVLVAGEQGEAGPGCPFLVGDAV
jgi:hypothetical protein